MDMRQDQEPQLSVELLRRFAQTFINQHNLYPVQLADGSYITIKEPLRQSLIERHLRGQITLGTYALDRESRSRWLVLDADTPELWQRLLTLSPILSERGLPPYLEPSRRGGHLWLFFDPQPGALARHFGRGVLATLGIESIELYPKQDELKTGPGSLVRLPFGIHRLTNKRYFFITPDGAPLAPSVREQMALLHAPRRVKPELFAVFAERGRMQAEKRQAHFRTVSQSALHEVSPTLSVSERVKQRISVLDFVSQYVDLNAQGKGYCPFHDDARMSFGVHQQENFWHCFAGCGGGSIIDFWMKWRQLHGQDDSFTETVSDLARMLL